MHKIKQNPLKYIIYCIILQLSSLEWQSSNMGPWVKVGGLADRQVDGQAGGWMGGQTGGQTDGWTEGRLDRRAHLIGI